MFSRAEQGPGTGEWLSVWKKIIVSSLLLPGERMLLKHGMYKI